MRKNTYFIYLRPRRYQIKTSSSCILCSCENKMPKQLFFAEEELHDKVL